MVVIILYYLIYCNIVAIIFYDLKLYDYFSKNCNKTHDFQQGGDIEIDYNESKVLKSLKRRLGLLRIKNQTQTGIDSFFK